MKVVILAAGRGSRMVSDRPKVLHPLGGKTLLEHVVDVALRLSPSEVIVVHHDSQGEVSGLLGHLPVRWVYQEALLGTGHAVSQTLPFIEPDDNVLVLYGDVPLVSHETLLQLIESQPATGLGLLVAKVENPYGFGRIIRNQLGHVQAIVEERDASEEEKAITEINTGIMICPAAFLRKALPQLNNANQQSEYYLTDIVAMAVQSGLSVGGVLAQRSEEVLGVNDRYQLSVLERYYQYQQAKRLARRGTMIIDCRRLDIRGDLTVGKDVVLDVNVVIEGSVVLGDRCHIGPGVVLKDSRLASDVTVLSHSHIEGADIGAHSVIGPFARLRPKTQIGAYSKVGNFVEIKNSQLGDEIRVSHLSYLGDTQCGGQVNIGAGTITCNYDGVNKWATQIGESAFVGANVTLVAPVIIGSGAVIGAGSVITKEAPSGQLSIARAKQSAHTRWRRASNSQEEKQEH